jgi:protein-S-isoprenylcysteine O-methyltransferase Ste14
MTRLGGWLFRHRTVIPLPLAIAVLGLRVGQAPASRLLFATGIGVTFIGEAIRLWGVLHIGAISRTRSERLGPLVAAGPFAIVRNPLYVGNVLLWVGFAIAARLVWLVPVIVVLLAFEYHAIVLWEELLLEARLGQDYREYAARVPRWVPRARSGARGLRRGQTFPKESIVPAFSWRDTVFSERGTLIAIGVGYALLWLKARF